MVEQFDYTWPVNHCEELHVAKQERFATIFILLEQSLERALVESALRSLLGTHCSYSQVRAPKGFFPHTLKENITYEK